MSCHKHLFWLVAIGPILLLAFACAPAPVSAPHVTVVGPWAGSEREAFMTVIDAFTARTKIPVAYESMRDEMGALLRRRVAQGDPPDVALVPRPGEVAEFARSGDLVDLGKFISNEELDKSFGQTFIDLGKVDGKQFGILFKANSKSTCWYKPTSFVKLGVQPPKTLNELFAIAERYKMSGQIPFAVGAEDAWVLTDYQENLLARLVSPETFNDLYVTHKVPWTDPRVKQSLALLAKLFQPGDEQGGVPGILLTSFEESIAQVFGPAPVSEMICEGGFVGLIATQDVNKNLIPGQDIDFFAFPQVDARFGDPVVGGGDTAVLFRDSPEARQFMRFLMSKEAADVLAAADTISPNKQGDPAMFRSLLTRKEYQQLLNAQGFLFDGSDLAPSSFGGDYLFTALQKLIQNPNDVDTIAQELENFARTAYKSAR